MVFFFIVSPRENRTDDLRALAASMLNRYKAKVILIVPVVLETVILFFQ
jgi:hypothetical protein